MKKTLKELDEWIQEMKEHQWDADRACTFGRAEEVCGFCRYIAGYWGDIEVEILHVE